MSFQLRSLLGLAILAPLAAAAACSSTNTGSAPISTTPSKDASTGGTNGDDASSLGGGNGDDDSGGTGSGSIGSDSGGGGLQSTGPESDAAAAVQLPQAYNSGGRIIAAPKFKAVVFSGYTYTSQVTDFMNKVGQSPFWTDSTTEYGVASVPQANVSTVTVTTVGETDCPSGQTGKCIDDDGIQTWLKSQWSGSGELGVSDTNTVYIIFFPESISITQGQGAYSCQQFGGYHDEVDLTVADPNNTGHNKRVAYAVIPTCAASQGSDLTPLNNVTLGAGHELVEAVTDPNPNTDPAWFFPMSGYSAGWALGNGAGELSDLCEQDPESDLLDPTLNQAVQRSWSNKAAAAGQDPCVPHVTETSYLNALPVPTDTTNVPFEQLSDGGLITLTNVSVAALSGTTPKTIEVKLIVGAGETAEPVEVEAIDIAGETDSQTGSTMYQYLSFTWDNAAMIGSGTANQVLHLTVTLTAQGMALANAGQTDSRMGASDFPTLPVALLVAHKGSDGGIDEEHVSFFTTDVTN